MRLRLLRASVSLWCVFLFALDARASGGPVIVAKAVVPWRVEWTGTFWECRAPRYLILTANRLVDADELARPVDEEAGEDPDELNLEQVDVPPWRWAELSIGDYFYE